MGRTLCETKYGLACGRRFALSELETFMDTWNIEDTRKHILRIHGADQLELAKPALNSTTLMSHYAKYHYHEAKKLLGNLTTKQFKENYPIELVLGLLTEKEKQKLELSIIKIEANIIACLFNIHAIADTLSHIVYYSFGLNLADNKLSEVGVNITSVSNLIKSNNHFSSVHKLLESLINDGDFDHLSAIVNCAKHRGIKRLKFSASGAENLGEPLSLKIPSYTYKTKSFPEIDLKIFLNNQYNRISKLNIDTGIEINKIINTVSWL